MQRTSSNHSRNAMQRQVKQRLRTPRRNRKHQTTLPSVAYRQRTSGSGSKTPFNAPEVWHEPRGDSAVRFVLESAGPGFIHPVTVDEVRARIAQLPVRFQHAIDTIQFSRMTHKRGLFPCYGMQWGPNIYLYPIEESLVEMYGRPPRPQQQIEARMYGGVWEQVDDDWTLTWTPGTIKDFYLNNILIHEIGHVLDERNTSFEDRERYANWFAVEYGYRASRGRR